LKVTRQAFQANGAQGKQTEFVVLGKPNPRDRGEDDDTPVTPRPAGQNWIKRWQALNAQLGAVGWISHLKSGDPFGLALWATSPSQQKPSVSLAKPGSN